MPAEAAPAEGRPVSAPFQGKSAGVRLTILSVSYSLAPVRPDTAGGAEQILGALDAALTRLGHLSVVVAPEGSAPSGVLVPAAGPAGSIDEPARLLAWQSHRKAISYSLQRWPIDLVHMHGLDFDQYLPPPGIPVLVTLHLPCGWYSREAFSGGRPRTYFNCVSSAQRETCPEIPGLLPEIENGVAVDQLAAGIRKRNFVFSLGRICPEKGFHIAAEAARIAGVPLVIAGEVFPYEEHRNYFRREIQPRLGKDVKFLGPVGFRRKKNLLSGARCLLAPSLAPETSSLVAMEALACGTPVVAYPHGALARIVEHGKTGFLVRSPAEMAEAIHECGRLDPGLCRRVARARFSADRMVASYLEVYRRIIGR